MEHQEIHVIGGGLGGLAAAALVARSGHAVVVHERRGRLGGRATTDQRDGFLFNQGPHALYVGGNAFALLRELGIRPRGTTPPTAGVRMVKDGELHRAPGGAVSLLRTGLLGRRDKAELAWLLTRLQRVAPDESAGRTVNEWVDGLTTRSEVRELLHAIVRLATYTNAPDQLSADVAIRQIQLAFGRGVLYLDGGWQQLVTELARVVTDAGGVILREDGAHELPDAGAVIVAVGGPSETSNVSGHRYPSAVPAEAAILDIALVRAPLHPFVIGVDDPIYLSDHGRPEGMCPDGRSSVSLAQYLAPGDQPERRRLAEFAGWAGIADGDVLHERYLHRMTTVSSIALASTGGLAGRASVQVPDRPGVFVVGDWVGAQGHLADAVLASARTASHAAVEHVTQIARAR